MNAEAEPTVKLPSSAAADRNATVFFIIIKNHLSLITPELLTKRTGPAKCCSKADPAAPIRGMFRKMAHKL
ncbi:hypothetical protein YDYSG_48370 [Paenibacillus tyrfis]|nr:hypothetical protein YDYSG_48370 [Paenibacillus tyrfis]